jgi:cell division septation protein DedD
MKINRAKLIELLVEKTGMGTDEIESQLKQLIDRILDAAERGKALEVKEFGMFYFDENGDLKFDPSDELSTEINFKYAGMEPVELKPARDQESKEQADELSGADEEADDAPSTSTGSDMDEIFGFDSGSDSDEDDLPIEDDAEGPDGGALISPPDKVDRDIDPFSGLLGDASSKMKGSEEKKEEEVPEEDPFSFLMDDDDDDQDTEDQKEIEPETGEEFESETAFVLDDDDDSEEVEAEDDLSKIFEEPAAEVEEEAEPVQPKEKKPKSAKKKPVKTSDKQRDPIMMVISIGLIIILIVAGFFIIPSLFDDSDSTSPQNQPAQETEQPSQTDPALEEEQQAVLTPVEPEEETAVTEEEPAPTTEPEQPIYGLNGDLVEEANDGYSIVLHSLQSEERARQQAANLVSDGYRVLVSPRLVRGETVWRVSVGQFQTLTEAQEQAAELPSPYSSNNFIQRIQTN